MQNFIILLVIMLVLQHDWVRLSYCTLQKCNHHATYPIDGVADRVVVFTLPSHLATIFLHQSDDDRCLAVLIIIIWLVDVDSVLWVDVESWGTNKQDQL